MTHSLDTHVVHTKGPDNKVTVAVFDFWRVLGNIWFFVFHLNRLNPVNHFQMYLVLFTVNSYTLMSCCHGPVARQTSPTSRCEVTFRQRLTCFLFQWSHCTVNICNGNTAEKMQYGLTGVKLQPSRSREEDALLKTDQCFGFLHIGQESVKEAHLLSHFTVNLIRLWKRCRVSGGLIWFALTLLWLGAFDTFRYETCVAATLKRVAQEILHSLTNAW